MMGEEKKANSSINSSTGSGSTEASSQQSAFQSAAATTSNNRVLNDGSYKVHIQHKATGQWFEVQDLRVTEVTPQFIGKTIYHCMVLLNKGICMTT